MFIENQKNQMKKNFIKGKVGCEDFDERISVGENICKIANESNKILYDFVVVIKLIFS